MKQHRSQRFAELLRHLSGEAEEARRLFKARTGYTKGRVTQFEYHGFGEKAGLEIAKRLLLKDRRWSERALGTPFGAAADSAAKTAQAIDPLDVSVHANVQPETAQPYPQGNQIPVVGSARLGDDGHFVELEYPAGHGDGWLDMVSRDPGAYALRCIGESMKPRIKSGEFVVVEPHREPVPGDEVLVKSTDGRVMVKRYLYRRDGRIHLHSVNEAHPSFSLAEEEIDVMHYVCAIVTSSRWQRADLRQD